MEIASEVTTSLQTIGQEGESYVLEWLKKNKYTIRARNYRTRCGEIDIIAQHKNTLIFIEVKLRSNNYFNLSQVITPSKQKKIIATAQHYLLNYVQDRSSFMIRFDVALIHRNQNELSLEYIANAFTQSDYSCW